MAWEYSGMVVLGLALLVGGYRYAQVSGRRRAKVAGPLTAVAGQLLFFLGVLLSTLPDFFS